jgi:hypothetical protein
MRQIKETNKMGILERLLGKEVDIRKEDRRINVRFPSMAGDENRMMTVQQLKQEYKDYLIFDPKAGEQVDLEKLANLENVNEVIAMPPISGG